MLLHVDAQMRHLVGVVLHLGFLIGGADLVLAGVWRDSEHRVGIERLLRADASLAALARFLFCLLPPL